MYTEVPVCVRRTQGYFHNLSAEICILPNKCKPHINFQPEFHSSREHLCPWGKEKVSSQSNSPLSHVPPQSGLLTDNQDRRPAKPRTIAGSLSSHPTLPRNHVTIFPESLDFTFEKFLVHVIWTEYHPYMVKIRAVSHGLRRYHKLQGRRRELSRTRCAIDCC